MQVVSSVERYTSQGCYTEGTDGKALPGVINTDSKNMAVKNVWNTARGKGGHGLMPLSKSYRLFCCCLRLVVTGVREELLTLLV